VRAPNKKSDRSENRRRAATDPSPGGEAQLARKTRKRRPRLKSPVCKPCWELRYCPYGPLVEQFPLSPDQKSLRDIRLRRAYWQEILTDGQVRTDAELTDACERFLFADPATWQWIKQFDTTDLECTVFGHICPVFFVAEGFTETKELRRTGRHIPRDIMLKVVRRDGQICQICHQPVPDNELEFDHVIPLSRGGPPTSDNLRLVCRSCNRKKSDSLAELLEGRQWSADPKEGYTDMNS
jgi:hypothetical protein